MKLEELAVKEAFDRGYTRVWLEGAEYHLHAPIRGRVFTLCPVRSRWSGDRRRMPGQKVIVEVLNEQ